MRVLFNVISHLVAMSRLMVSTPKHSLSLKQLKRRKSFNDMVMSLMARSESVKKRLKLLLTHLIILKFVTKTTVTNSCKELKVPTLNVNKFLKTSAEPHLKPCSRNVESFSNCNRISKVHLVK